MSSLSFLKRVVKLGAATLLARTGALNLVWNRDPSWRILMYHRVIDPEKVPYTVQAGMYVRPRTFRMHCDVLRRSANVIPVDELVETVLSGKKLPKRTVAITFDDGWKDNYDNAFGVLKSLDLPATVFLPTKFIDGTELFWTDEISRALKAFPASFKSLLTSEDDTAEEQLERVLSFLFSLAPTKRAEMITSLTKNLEPNAPREFLSWSEVLALKALGIGVGSHSHTHRLFEELNETERLNELTTSLEILESKQALTSRIFVYPRGSYAPDTASEPLKAGYTASLGVMRRNEIEPLGPVFPRVGIHEDMTNTVSLFKLRVGLG